MVQLAVTADDQVASRPERGIVSAPLPAITVSSPVDCITYLPPPSEIGLLPAARIDRVAAAAHGEYGVSPLPVLIDQFPLSSPGITMGLLPPPATTVPEPPFTLNVMSPMLDNTD